MMNDATSKIDVEMIPEWAKRVAYRSHDRFISYKIKLLCNRNNLPRLLYTVCQKSDTPVNYVNITSYKLKNTRNLHHLNNFNIHYYWFIELCVKCVHPATVQPEYKMMTPFFNAAVNEALW